MSLILLGILNSQSAGAAAAGAYDLLETTILGTDTNLVTFTGLGSYTDYQHLQVRMTLQNDFEGSAFDANLRFYINGDSSESNEYNHELYGDGSSVTSNAGAGGSKIDDIIPGKFESTDIFSAVVMDILDFASANKNTTFRSLGGAVMANEKIVLHSAGKFVTNAVTSITFDCGFNFSTGSRFSLYGIKGA